MQDLRPKVLEYVRINGPILPVNVSKSINSNILFSSAVLSELVSNGQVFMSNAKVGGSSLYYIKGQEYKLQTLREHLGDMPKKAYDLLKQKIVLMDKGLEPYQRVALRELKDFAVPIAVKQNNQETLFWKWYLTPDDIAKKMIEEILGIKQASEETAKKTQEKEDYQETLKPAKELLVKEGKQAVQKEKQQKQQKPAAVNEDVLSYFRKNNIAIISTEQIKRNKETAFIVYLSSQIGNLQYFAYFKDKKKINDEDLILAYHKGQQHKMPVLFLTTGSLSKSAEEYIKKNINGMLAFKKI